MQSSSSINKSSTAVLIAMLSMPGPQGWADLPHDLLHSIVPFIISARDFLAFTATCPGWRAAFTLASVKYSTLSHLFPPLIFRHRCHLQPANSKTPHTWEIIDHAYPKTPLRRVICPPGVLDEMEFIGCSYGHAIFRSFRSYAIVDVFTGATVSAPLCPLVNPFRYYAALTPPLQTSSSSSSSSSLHSSYLLVCTPTILFAWQVGSSSWLQCPYPRWGVIYIQQIVVFRGQVFARNRQSLYAVSFRTKFKVQKRRVVWIGDDNNDMAAIPIPKLCAPWLVVCGNDDMLLLLGGHRNAFRLDVSAKPARFVRVGAESLEKWAFFISEGDDSTRLSCASGVRPERRGIKGGNAYGLDWGSHVRAFGQGCCPDSCCSGSGDRSQGRSPGMDGGVSYKYTNFAAWMHMVPPLF